MNHLNDLDNEELLSTHAQLSGKLMQRYLSEEEQTQLREMQKELLRRMTAAAESYCSMGVACPMHDGQVHGQEASELRTKLEQYINCIDVIENGSDVTKELKHILDSTDARDSLAFEEQAAVECIFSSEHSDVPELTTGTLEYQVNQLSLANAQLQEAVEFLETELRKMRDRFVQEVPGP